MITAFELACLALEGNLESEKYKILTVQPKGSFEGELGMVAGLHHEWEDIHPCVGAIHHCGELGYLVKIVREIPTAHSILGVADAIYEVDTTEDENLYYAVWAIQKDYWPNCD